MPPSTPSMWARQSRLWVTMSEHLVFLRGEWLAVCKGVQSATRVKANLRPFTPMRGIERTGASSQRIVSPGPALTANCAAPMDERADLAQRVAPSRHSPQVPRRLRCPRT
jgi:hypothetical protein